MCSTELYFFSEDEFYKTNFEWGNEEQCTATVEGGILTQASLYKPVEV